MQTNPVDKSIIHLDSPASSTVLSGILDISVSMVHNGRSDGKLPGNTQASYRECIQHYVNHYKTKVNSKAGSMYEAKIEQDIRNGIAKEELQWLEIKQQKELLIDVNQMKDLFEPIFHVLKSSLVNLARKNPAITKDIDNMLESLYVLGAKVEAKAKSDSSGYVRDMLEREIELPEATEQVSNRFGIDELL